MSAYGNTIVLSASAAALLIWGGVWLLRLAGGWVPARLKGQDVSLFVCILPFIGPIFFYQDRSAAALYTNGLSLQNEVQVATTVLATAWAIWLVYSRRLRLATLLLGPTFWITTLVCIYLASTLWSIWPTLTLYRSFELGVYAVVALHLFSHREWYRFLHRFLFWMVLVLLVATTMVSGIGALLSGHVFGGLRANNGGPIAAAYLLQTIHARLYLNWKPRTWHFGLGAMALILFGSLASVVAFLGAAVTLASFKAGTRYRWWLSTVALSLAAVLAAWLATVPQSVAENYAKPIAEVSGKTPAMILNVNGRFPLWTAVFRATRDKPFGEGFVAGERLFVVFGNNESLVGWDARSAHSGFVSAWMGAGVIGLAIVLAIYAGVGIRTVRADRRVAPMMLSFLVLLAVNNMTVIGVGGELNPVWLLMIALSTCPPAKQLEGSIPISK